ncbi:hypothetical protein [Chlorogloeopsis sp. ULAP02]|uniref:hypothetical protein n=1 Tax=Chlorogloeopsis sp. ULAP02 TaxID=3107926 RepID=UPI0031373A18
MFTVSEMPSLTKPREFYPEVSDRISLYLHCLSSRNPTPTRKLFGKTPPSQV